MRWGMFPEAGFRGEHLFERLPKPYVIVAIPSETAVETPEAALEHRVGHLVMTGEKEASWAYRKLRLETETGIW